MQHILTLDIGGTNPRMAIVAASVHNQKTTYTVVAKRLVDKQNNSLINQINTFLRDMHNEQGFCVDTCCVSVAGPVENNACMHPTHAQYPVDGAQIIRETTCKHTIVINDFAAIAYGVSHLDKSATLLLTPSVTAQSANKAVIGPGTGLGVAYIPLVAGVHKVVPSEGGNATIGYYAPYAALISYMHDELGVKHVDAESLISGSGITAIATYLHKHPKELTRINAYLPAHASTKKCKKTSIIADALSNKKIYVPQFISANAHTDLLCNITLRVFFELLGSISQTVALHGLTLGGLYIAGGIVPKNKELLLAGDFMRSFLAHHRASTHDLLAKMPIYLITDYDIAFIGCAHVAKEGL